MAIRIARGVVTQIREHCEGFVLQVREAADEQAATAALSRAREELIELLDPSLITEPLPAGEGPWIAIDAHDRSKRQLRAVPEVLARALEREGITDALIASAPEGGGQLAYEIGRVPRAVVLRLFPPPLPVQWPPQRPPPLAEGWLGEAAAWACAGLCEQDELMALVGAGPEFALRAGDLLAFLERLRTTELMSALFVAGELGTQIRGVNLRAQARPVAKPRARRRRARHERRRAARAVRVAQADRPPARARARPRFRERRGQLLGLPGLTALAAVERDEGVGAIVDEAHRPLR
jgi:hypothetical protein